MTRRIERAMALLRGGVSVTDTCKSVGFTSLGSDCPRTCGLTAPLGPAA